MIDKLLIGKVDNNLNWLPLYVHLNDTSGIMRCLLEDWISDATIESCDMRYEDFYAVALFVAYIHDIGKATSYFQGIISNKVALLYDNLSGTGLNIHENIIHQGKTPHAYAGQWILQSDTIGLCLPQEIANVIGAHHGIPYPNQSLNRIDDLVKLYPGNFYGEENNETQYSMWQSIWHTIVDEALNVSELESITTIPTLTTNAQILLSGLLIIADWIASNTSLFPLIGIMDNPYDIDCNARIVTAWNKLHFPESWHSEIYSMNDQIFQERFDFKPNEVQKAVIRAVNSTNAPGIFILEAQMGIGKTEAALSMAEVIASKCNSTGIFMGLPTQATCNGLYDRLYQWASSVSEDTLNAIKLAHSGANYNKNYQQQVIQGRSVIDSDDNSSGIYVHPWFQGNKKSLLADFVIGTVDQFLMSSLRRRHFMLRHLGLSGKVVIIDECHAYDAYMNQYLDQSIEWMASYGVPVILLSATLPLNRRNDLINRYLEGLKRREKGLNKICDNGIDWKTNISYPLLTWTDGMSIHQTNIDQPIKNRKVKLHPLHNSDQVIDILDDKLSEGGCACVILNTIKSAQMYYQLIKEAFPDAQVLLYHSQFTMEHRLEKEKILLERMGKKSSDTDRNRFILIGTQVLEQSLDYDADILITQLCPMDLLLQRIGRLHRHNRDDIKHHYSRPKKLQEAHCYVLLDSTDETPDIPYDSGSKRVYGDYLLMRTFNILPDEISIPQDIPQLVQRVYNTDDNCGLTNNSHYSDAITEFNTKISKKQSNAKCFLLKYPRKENIRGMLENENPDSNQNGDMSVRDIESSIEIIIMKQYNDDEIGFVYSNNHSNDKRFHRHNLSDEDGIEIARQRLYLPQLFSSPWMLHQTIKELEDLQNKLPDWQHNPWLQGELIVLLDNNNTANLCGHRLYYDFELGLIVEKEETHG